MTSRQRSTTVNLIGSLASVVVVAVAAGCAQSASAGNPVQAPPESIPSSDIRTLCEDWVDSDVAGRELLTLDFVADPAEKIKQTVIAFWAEEEAILNSMEGAAPDELKQALDALIQLARSGLINGDPGTLVAPQLTTSDRAIDAFMLRECGYREVPIVATDTQYQGVPSALGAETVAITLTNRGLDKHEIRISRVKDGVALSLPEILAQSPAQQATLTTPISFADADPGSSNTVFVPLTSGRYVIFDTYLQGTTAATQGSGPPHFTLGMMGEFTVA